MGVCCKGAKPTKKKVKPVELYTRVSATTLLSPYMRGSDQYKLVKDVIAFPSDASVTEIVQAVRDSHVTLAQNEGERYTQTATDQVVRARILKERYAKIDKLDAALALLGGA